MTPENSNEGTDGGLPTTSCCASWILGDKPDTPKGSSTLMWVTMRHKETGKLSVGVLTYHNGHVMPCSDQCDPPGCAVPHNPEEDGYCEEYEWTCWSDGYCEQCETEWVWSSRYVEIIAHAPVSKPEPFLHNAPRRSMERLVMPLRVLRLTLKKKWFDMIASGEKREEYRAETKWILSRLVGKDYDVVEFKNGYGPNVPTMEVEYQGYIYAIGKPEWGGNGEHVIVICLGRVISRHNVDVVAAADSGPKTN